jgi:hypothetical protein
VKAAKNDVKTQRTVSARKKRGTLRNTEKPLLSGKAAKKKHANKNMKKGKHVC